MFASGQFFDISPFLAFLFNEPVYFLGSEKQEFLSDSRELHGGWVGISDDVGNSLCYIIYNESEGTIVHRSEVYSALNPKLQNLREDPFLFESGPHSDVRHAPSVLPALGETITQFVRDVQSDGEKIHQSQSSDVFEKYIVKIGRRRFAAKSYGTSSK